MVNKFNVGDKVLCINKRYNEAYFKKEHTIISITYEGIKVNKKHIDFFKGSDFILVSGYYLKGYNKGLRKGLKIIQKYHRITQDEYIVEIINEFKELLGQKLLKKIPIKQDKKEIKFLK